MIRGSRKNRESSDRETRNQSRVKWQLPQDQQKEADNRLLSFWQLIGGESSNPQNINRELVAASEESVPIPISIVPAQPEERKLSDELVTDVDLTTTDEIDDDQEVCGTKPPKRQAHIPKEEKKLQRQQTEDTLDILSKLFEKCLLAELTSEDTWMERGDKQGFELMGPYNNPLLSQMAVETAAYWRITG